ncbi:unnamed protein product [Urochloa humidicola]
MVKDTATPSVCLLNLQSSCNHPDRAKGEGGRPEICMPPRSWTGSGRSSSDRRRPRCIAAVRRPTRPAAGALAVIHLAQRRSRASLIRSGRSSISWRRSSIPRRSSSIWWWRSGHGARAVLSRKLTNEQRRVSAPRSRLPSCASREEPPPPGAGGARRPRGRARHAPRRNPWETAAGTLAEDGGRGSRGRGRWAEEVAAGDGAGTPGEGGEEAAAGDGAGMHGLDGG